jgi:hypothetical protein
MVKSMRFQLKVWSNYRMVNGVLSLRLCILFALKFKFLLVI